MNGLLLSAVLFAQVPAPTATKAEPANATASLDGSWTVVCYEKNGQPMAEAKDCTVTMKDNVATFTCKNEKDKIMAIRFECGQNGTIKATEIANAGTEPKPGDKSQTKTGVIVKTTDYVAICVHEGGKPGEEPKTGEQPVSAETKAYCTVVLKRAGGEK